MKNLSILIPTYNDACAKLVDTLRQQAEALDISYEIIVADDGSTNAEVVRSNRQIKRPSRKSSRRPSLLPRDHDAPPCASRAR